MDEPTVMDSIFEQYAKTGMVDEANQFRTVKAGSYRLQITKAEPRLTKPSENNPEGNRPYVHFTATILGEDDKKHGNVFFNASPAEGRTKDGRLDGMAKLWGNMEKAFDTVGKTVGTTCEVAQKYPCKAYITVSYKDADNKYYYLRSDNGSSVEDIEKGYRELGYTPVNNVQNISKL